MSNASFRQGDGVTGFEGERFDCVCFTQALASTYADERAHARLATLLRDRGRFVCVESFDGRSRRTPSSPAARGTA